MDEKSFNEGIKTAKEKYFAAADAVLARLDKNSSSVDSFRKVLAAGKKNRKNQAKKAAS